MDNGADIIAFAGGDGTARDILDITKGEITVIGIPTGVKMQSAVFSITPNQAGSLLDAFISGKINGIKQLEVMDLNEADYINNKISSTLYGYLPVPYDKKGSHAKKSASPLTDEAGQRSIALDFIDNMNEKLYYLIGPGSTTKAIADELKEESTLLGFDVLNNGKIYSKDVNEYDIMKLVSEKGAENMQIVLTPIGGQGMLLGRGNQQVSPSVLALINKEQITVLATKNKLASLHGKSLYIDSGNDEIDEKMKGYYKVITGYKESTFYKLQ